MMQGADLLRHAGVDRSAVIKSAGQTAATGLNQYTGPLPDLDGKVNLARMWDYSARGFARNVQVPTLVLDAEKEELWDPKDNGNAVYEIIKANKVPCEYALLPDATHYGAYESAGYHTGQKEAIRWFQMHLMTEPERQRHHQALQPQQAEERRVPRL
jgi:acetyl esterase/lipase